MMARLALRPAFVLLALALLATVASPSSRALAASSTHRRSPSSVARALAAKRTHHPQKSLPALGATASASVSPAAAQPNSLQRSALVSPALAATGNVYESQFTGEVTKEGSFRPYGLAVDSSGDVFVADIEHGVIDEFNASGSEVLAEITGSETHAGSFVPYDVAVSAAGEVYVADAEHGVVDEFAPGVGGKYTLGGEITGAKTAAGSFEPFSLAVDAAGDVLVGDLAHGVVDEFNDSGSELLGEVTGSETKAGSFAPFGLATDASGNLYVADIEHGVVDELELNAGKYTPVNEISQGSPFEPFRVAVSPSGDIYVEDLSHEVVDRFSASGAYECDISGSNSEEQCGGEASMTPQGSFEPTGVAVGPTGEIYVGDSAHNLVDIFSAPPAPTSSSNVYRSQFTGAETKERSFRPYGLAVSSSGDVFVADIEHGVIDEFNASGSEVLAEINEKTAGKAFVPYDVAVNAAGDVYVADPEQGVVDEFEPAAGGGEYSLIHEITSEKAGFEPFSLAVNAAGDVFVGDLAHGVVDEFNASGSEVGEITGVETEAGSFAPFGLATDASGDVYVADIEHGVVDEFEPTGDGYEYKKIRETKESSPFEPFRVAVAANGDMYVEDLGQEVVDRFSPSGVYECDISGSSSEEQCGGEVSMTPQGSFEPTGVAVGPGGELYVGDSAHDLINIFSAAASSASSQWTTTPATTVTTTGATLTGTVNPESGPVTACEFEYGTTTSYGTVAPCEQTEAQIGEGSEPVPVSADISGLEPNTTYYYRVQGEGVNGPGNGEQETFPTKAKPPVVRIDPVTGPTAHGATFHGEVNPEGSPTTYRFEDSTDGVHWTALGEANAGTGTSNEPVTQHVSGLLGSTTYHVRLEAENASKEPITSGEEEFSTSASAPQIFSFGADVLSYSEATLYATIYPENQATTYRFEYGTTTAYGATVPAGGGEAGSGSPTQVSQTLAGLMAATTYHFRVVATNAMNTTYSADRSFTTPVTPVEGEKIGGSCPNETMRAEGNIDPATHAPYSTQLPDCRAYEQVTPPFKSFNNLGTSKGGGIADAGTNAVAASGAAVLEESVPLLGTGGAGADEEIIGTFYELARTASGWTATGLTPIASAFPIAKDELPSPDDIAVGVWFAGTPSQSSYAENYYRREADGSFVNIGPIAPPAATEGPPRGAKPSAKGSAGSSSVVAASADLSDIVFQIHSQLAEGSEPSYLWAGDGTVSGGRPSLYEYVGTGHSGEGSGVPALVGVDNGGAQISQCGTGLGANVEREAHAVHNGISAGGSTSFFTAQAAGCVSGAAGPVSNQVYARIGVPGAPQATVNVAGRSGCVRSSACNVTSPVTFQGASSDGSKVFFTAAQAGLVAGDSDATNALYECELPGDGGSIEALEAEAKTSEVDACPGGVKAISVPVSGGAEVQGVVAVSEEGSRVYFTAKGVLSSEPDRSLPAGHQVAEEGMDNLYVWEALGDGEPSGHVSFIAALPGSSPNEAQATPDGRFLVFTTTADLTSDDTSTAAQAFRYDAHAGELVRISAGQEGFNDDGNTSSDPVTLASTKLDRLTISEDGSYVVFQSSDALTPQVRGGLNNVYEWHEGDVYLISDGTDSGNGAGLIGMDASGENIFFVTADKLVGQDTDESRDLYDARIGGGFPATAATPSCKSEECQGAPTSPLSPGTSGSSGSPAIGNLTPGPTNFPEPTQPASVKVTRHSVKGSTVMLSVEVSGKGHLAVAGHGLRPLYMSAAKAGTYKLKLVLTRGDKTSLRKHRRLKLRLQLVFTPTSGKAVYKTVTISLKAK